jgi:hypothetical protein
MEIIKDQLGYGQARTRYTFVNGKEFIALALYVDDILTIDNSSSAQKHLVEALKRKFKITEGESSWLLGMAIESNQHGIAISQTKYIKQIIAEYGLESSRTVTTPTSQTSDNKDLQPVDRIEFLKMVGSLIYASVITRPDISFAVSKAGRASSNPNTSHWKGAKHIFRYLQGTTDLKISYSKSGNAELIGYSDSDYAGDTETRRSTSGWVFILAGAAVSWASKRQPTTALSTTEAEYMAVCSAVQESIYLRTIIKELGLIVDKPTRIWMDNQSAIKLGENAFSNKRAKHIDIRYHFTREKVEEGVIDLKYIETTKMVADILTKGVSPTVVRMANEALFGKQSKPITSLRESIGNHPSDKAMITSTHGEENQDMDLILRGITSSKPSKEEDENLR